MNIWQRWKQTSIANKALVWSGAIVAIGTALSTGALITQICIARENNSTTSKQVDKIIIAAATQADAARQIASAADSFSHTAETAVAEFKKAAKQSAISSTQAANNAEKAIKQAQDSFRDEQRAWIISIDIDPPEPSFAENVNPHWSVSIQNTGRTPAMKAKPLAAAWPFLKGQPFVPVYTDFSIPQSVGIISPNARPRLITGPTLKTLTKSDVDLVKSGDVIWYVYGTISYEDISGRPHHTTFCYYLNRDLTTHSACNTYNEAD